jgi:D-alanyl-D-alanine carboxypeptidase/D-alanyl-D-alanine carboxypeptidase (penicillin-binding protein 5/6)
MRKKIVSFVVAVAMIFTDVVHACAEEDFLNLSAKSAVLMSGLTGNVLYGKNADERRAIASITKVMTALLTIESGNLDVPFVVDDYSVKIEGTTMGLRGGDIVTRRDLCYGMLLPSGNDAANAAAVNISGTENAFVELMNQRAKQIGMHNTHFSNPHGLDEDDHYSTAYDMAVLTYTAMKNPLFREISGKSSVQLKFGNPPYTRYLVNNNKMLFMYNGCNGVKTGYTDNAKRCLISSAERDGVFLICVTLNAADDWKDHTKMLDYGFERTKNREMPDTLINAEIPTSTGNETIPLIPSEKIMLPLSDEEIGKITVKMYVKPYVYAGAKAGETSGTAEIFCNEIPVKKVTLVTSRDSYEQHLKRNIVTMLENIIS